MGVKSRFSNSSLGEPASIFPFKIMEIGASHKSQELLNSPARAAGFPCARYRMVFSWSAAAIEALTQFRNKCVFVQGYSMMVSPLLLAQP